MEATTPQTGTLSRIFSEISKRREAKQRQAIESFADLVNRFWEFERGRGPEPTVDEVEAVLAASDRAPDNLESTLAYRRSILRNAEQALKAEEHLAKVKAAREEVAAIEKEFEAAKVKRERGIAAAVDRENVAASASREANEALGRLGRILGPSTGVGARCFPLSLIHI